MKFEDLNLGTQVGMSLEKFCNYHHLPLRECGVGTFQEKSGRDAHRAWCLVTVNDVMYYIYLQVAYGIDPSNPHKRISKVSSIILYDFSSGTTLAKTHLNSVVDMKDFYNQIEPKVLR
jgi:hypothetical protein